VSVPVRSLVAAVLVLATTAWPPAAARASHTRIDPRNTTPNPRNPSTQAVLARYLVQDGAHVRGHFPPPVLGGSPAPSRLR
jgi:hypothetical protein